MFPSGNKECEVVAYYKSPNLYRVELKNVGNNEPQIMIKNQDGIYVLLPSVVNWICSPPTEADMLPKIFPSDGFA